MIHTLLVGPETLPDELKKQFRKKLMTGGAVLRLRPELSGEELQMVFDNFADGATEHNVNGMVLVELCRAATLPTSLRSHLAEIPLTTIQRALAD